MINWLFQICVIFLEWLGRVTRLSYEEASVVFNLWIQGGLLVVSALVSFCLALTSSASQHYAVMVTVTSVLLLLYSILFGWMVWHYRGNMDDAFALCVDDLDSLANRMHVSYNAVNIFVFVFCWLITFEANVVIAYQLWR